MGRLSDRLFVDRLVDALIADDRFEVATDAVKRTPSSLKYCLTEAVCADAGGRGWSRRDRPRDDCGVPPHTWEAVKLTAQAAADPSTTSARAVRSWVRSSERLDPLSSPTPLPAGTTQGEEEEEPSPTERRW